MTANRKTIHCVLLAGGSGTRLWPASRKLHPKQFTSLATGSALTMLQQTASRLSGVEISNYLTLCSEEHRFLVAEQLREIDKTGPIILEPEGRGTAPAIALAAIASRSDGDDPILIVLPCDHQIADHERFVQAMQKAIDLAEAGYLTTFGVLPTEAATGYGYIQAGETLSGGGFTVARFVEKPDFATATQLLEREDYFWNSGMFVFRASTVLEALGTFAPDVLNACEAAMQGAQQDLTFIRAAIEPFLSSPNISIDHAVMEKTPRAALVPLDAGWFDLGSWGTIWKTSSKDVNDNSTQGKTALYDSQRCLVMSSGRLIGIVGVEDLVVVETKDAVLVCDRHRTEDVKALTDVLRESGASESDTHREVFRPWGKYDAIDQGSNYQVKKLTVKPGAGLSLQRHRHRAEHWVVVSGTAKVRKGEQEFLLEENQSTYIAVGEVHRLENPGEEDLELIEVQSGSYLGEDDIVRLEDHYSRS